MSVQVQTNRMFSLKQFKQLLGVQNSLYEYDWKKLTGSREYKLFINIPEDNITDELLSKRTNYFKSKLIELTLKAHDEHLKAVVRKRPDEEYLLKDYDALKSRAWHHTFDPNDSKFITEIEPVEIVQKPEHSRSESVSEYLKRNRSSSKRDSMKDNSMMFSYYKSTKVAPNALCAISKEKAPAESKSQVPDHLSEIFLRIAEKEKSNKIEIEAAELERKNNKPKILEDKLVKLADSIKSIYAVFSTNTLFKGKLIDELKDSQRGCFDTAIEIETNIKHLHKASPQWLKLISLPNGLIVKISPKYKKSEIKADITKYAESLPFESDAQNEKNT